MLAVLPNNPSLIHIAKNRSKLKEKRDRLLDKLAMTGKIDALTLELSKAEEIFIAAKRRRRSSATGWRKAIVLITRSSISLSSAFNSSSFFIIYSASSESFFVIALKVVQ